MTASQRWSTITNVAYIAIGVGAWRIGGELSYLFGLACLLLGLGSGLFHLLERRGYEVRRYGQWADRAGMYAVVSVLALLGLGISSPWAVIGVWVLLGLGFFYLPSIATVGGLGGIAWGGVLLRGAYSEAVVILALFGVAWWIHEMGDASSWAHGSWHLISSCALAGMYATLTGLL